MSLKESLKRSFLYNMYISSKCLGNYFKIKTGYDESDMKEFFANLGSSDLKDEQKDGYIERHEELKDELQELINYVDETISNEVTPEGYVVDFGCGTGRYLELFKDKTTPVAVDTSVDVVETVTRKKVPNGEFHHFDFTDKPAYSKFIEQYKGKVDSFYIIEVIQILRRSKIEDFLQGVHQLLKKEGLFLIVFPMPQVWKDKYQRIGFYNYPPKELEGLLESAGFKIEDSFSFLTKNRVKKYSNNPRDIRYIITARKK